ncbi:MAG: PDZ domain-containing protein [Myxococcota bacterium]
MRRLPVPLRVVARCGLPALLTLVACAYPVRGTTLAAVQGSPQALQQPNDVYRVVFRGATIPPRTRDGVAWDDDGSPPDVVARLYRGQELLLEVPATNESLEATFPEAPSANLRLPRNEELRLELWDEDGISERPIGIWRGQGLPRSALPGADARVMLEGRAQLMFRIVQPEMHRGTGIPEFEVRKDALVVREVLAFSPAGRAGVRPGDRIVAIGDDLVATVGGNRAASLLSRAGTRRGTVLRLLREETPLEVELDGDYVWLAQ